MRYIGFRYFDYVDVLDLIHSIISLSVDLVCTLILFIDYF